MEWSEFAWRLGRELAGLERDTILIVRERDESRHYVQAMREPDRLYAEAVSNNFLEGPLLLTLADEEVMSDAGWRPPADPAPRNWWTELPEFGVPGGMQSVTGGDFSRLADVMVTALRDVQGVRRPSDLVYESFHRHGTGLIELTDFGIDVADPSRVNKRRASSGEPAAGPADPVGDPIAPVGDPVGDPIAPVGVPPLAGADPLPAGTPPAGGQTPPQGPGPADAELLEPRLTEAKANGDNTAYFQLLANADLVLPATAPAVEDPDRAEFPTITIGGDTYVTVFTSPGALAHTGDRHPGLYRRTSFARLAAGWPDPAWRLAINWGLPSEVLLDSSVLPRLHEGPGTAPPAEPDVSNPYGTVDPNALSGPNPVAGGSAPTSNGSVPSADGAQDDSHTAVDAYTVAELRAALEAGTAALPASPAEPGGAAEARPTEPQAPQAQAPQAQAPQAQPAEPPLPEPPGPEPRLVEAGPPEPERPLPERPEPARPEPARPELERPEASPAEPRHLESERLEPERPEPERLDPGRPESERLEPGRPEPGRVQQEAVLPLGAPPGKPAPAKQQDAGVPMRLPHGVRLWRWTGEGDETPLAVYDAVGGVWAPVRTDAVPAPRTE